MSRLWRKARVGKVRVNINSSTAHKTANTTNTDSKSTTLMKAGGNATENCKRTFFFILDVLLFLLFVRVREARGHCTVFSTAKVTAQCHPMPRSPCHPVSRSLRCVTQCQGHGSVHCTQCQGHCIVAPNAIFQNPALTISSVNNARHGLYNICSKNILKLCTRAKTTTTQINYRHSYTKTTTTQINYRHSYTKTTKTTTRILEAKYNSHEHS